MANTTGKKFGGRSKGTPNKNTIELRKQAEEIFGEAVPITMLRWAKKLEERGEIAEGGTLAGTACKYIYATLKAVELSGELKTTPIVKVTIDGDGTIQKLPPEVT